VLNKTRHSRLLDPSQLFYSLILFREEAPQLVLHYYGLQPSTGPFAPAASNTDGPDVTKPPLHRRLVALPTLHLLHPSRYIRVAL
jgi:hypothetical protein